MVREIASQRQWDKIAVFFRHGQSDDNIRPIFQSPDSPLSPRGHDQALLLSERAYALSLEALVCSSMLRAEQSIVPMVKRTGIVSQVSDLFVERLKPSSINGKSYHDPEASKIWGAWEESLYSHGLRVEDGENLDDIFDRVDSAFAFLENLPYARIGVMTHGFFLRAMLARVLMGTLVTGPLFRRFQFHAEMQNTGITILRYRKEGTAAGWHLWTYNDHAHLG